MSKLDERMEMLESMTKKEFVEYFKGLVERDREMIRKSEMYSVYSNKKTPEEDAMCQHEERHEAHHSSCQKDAFKYAKKLLSGIIEKWSNHDTDDHTLKVSTAYAIMNYLIDMHEEDREVVKQFLKDLETHVVEMVQKTEAERKRVSDFCLFDEDSFIAIPPDEDNIYLRNEKPPGLTRQNACDYQDYPGFENELKVLKDFMSCMKLEEDRDLLMGIFIEHFGEV